jgi:hypothetical protein
MRFLPINPLKRRIHHTTLICVVYKLDFIHLSK